LLVIVELFVCFSAETWSSALHIVCSWPWFMSWS